MKKRQMLSLVLIAMFAVSMNGCSKSASVESVEKSEFEEVIVEETFEWPGGDEIPVLDCDDGTVLWDNSNGFAMTVNNILQDDFEAYTIECEDDGYMRYYDLDGKYYLVNRESGYDLTLIHNGGDMLYICVDKLPELELEEVEDVRPEVVAYMTEIEHCLDDLKDNVVLFRNRFMNVCKRYDNAWDELTEAEETFFDEEGGIVFNKGKEVGELLGTLDDAITEEYSEEQEIETESEPSSTDGIRPEFKQSMDSYEAFFDEYCAFMTKYRESNNALSMLSDYTEFMKKYTEAMEDLNALEESAMNDAETAYYLEVMTRINQKLLESIQ